MAVFSDLVGRLRALSLKITMLETAVGRCACDLEGMLELATCLEKRSSLATQSCQPLKMGRFVVDRTNFSISDGNRACELGNTLCFRFLEFLASEPNRFFTQDELLAAVWDGQRRAPTTVRSTAFELRSRLRNAEMNELADALRNKRRAYGLMFGGRLRMTQRKTNSKPNGFPTPER